VVPRSRDRDGEAVVTPADILAAVAAVIDAVDAWNTCERRTA
jgi:hypothetical protein